MDTEPSPGASPSERGAELVRELAASRDTFERFLARRVGGREVAAELLQDAFVRAAASAHGVRDGESAVAWFYRVLRNAIADHHRSAGRAAADLAEFADELADGDAAPAPLRASVCRCVGELARTLKPEYADALRRIDVEGAPVSTFAAEAGITSANAAQRVVRARAALRERVEHACRACAEHGCLDCTCRASETSG